MIFMSFWGLSYIKASILTDSKYIGIFFLNFIKYAFKFSIFSFFKQQKSWFCQHIYNVGKATQNVHMKLVYFAEGILVSYILKNKKNLLNYFWVAPSCSFLNDSDPVALKKKYNSPNVLYHYIQCCRIWYDIAFNHITRNCRM